ARRPTRNRTRTGSATRRPSGAASGPPGGVEPQDAAGRGQPRRAAGTAASGAGNSPLTAQQIDDPAAAHVRPRSAGVLQDGAVRAAGVVQGVGQDRQTIEPAIVVDVFGKRDDSRRPPGGNKDWRTKLVGEGAAGRKPAGGSELPAGSRPAARLVSR